MSLLTSFIDHDFLFHLNGPSVGGREGGDNFIPQRCGHPKSFNDDNTPTTSVAFTVLHCHDLVGPLYMSSSVNGNFLCSFSRNLSYTTLYTSDKSVY